MRHSTGIRPERRSGQRGFSMLEIFIILGIVAILAAIASPYFRDMVGRYRLNASSRLTASYINQARMLAVTRGTYVRLLVTAIDPAVNNGGSSEGVFRLEQFDPIQRSWALVEDPATRNSDALPADTCDARVGPRLNEFCVDFKVQYPGISIGWMDQAGSAGSSGLWTDPVNPNFNSLVYGPDGFIANLRDDFTPGDPQSIQIVIVSKRSAGMLDGRILVVDRAGTVVIRNYKGHGLPAT